MKPIGDFVSEYRFSLMIGIAIVGFFALAFSQKSTGAETTASFREIDNNSSMFRGDAAAPVSVIQYSDFLCPSCSLFSTTVMPDVDRDYIVSGKVKFEFRPMAFIADGSKHAGAGGYCAVDQGAFWPYHDAIYQYVSTAVFLNGKDPTSDTIMTADVVKGIAKDAGLKQPEFDECLDSEKHYADIYRSTNEANRNGVTGTPYIMVNGQVYQGNLDLTSFSALIKTKL